MPFRLADVKRTVRSRSDGERYVHPKLLEAGVDERRIELALNYFEAHLGRARADLDAEALMRFLGEPIIARGVVVCLSGTYQWRCRRFPDVLEERQVAHLASLGIATPSELRLHLFDALNRGGDGFLGADRDVNLQPLGRRLRLTTAKLDQLVALDAEEHAVLVRSGPVPHPEQMLRAYNFAVVEALLRQSEVVCLTGISAAVHEKLERACALHRVTLRREGDQSILLGAPDVFGSFARSGGRLTRALFTAAAGDPALLRRGRARVRTHGKAAWYELDRRAVQALTGGSARIRLGGELCDLREQWDRLRQHSGTGGWRLQINPEPVLTEAGLAIAPAACRHGAHTVLLWPVTSRAAADDGAAIADGEVPVLAVADARQREVLPDHIPVTASTEGAAGIVAALNLHWAPDQSDIAEQALENLLRELTDTGFIEESRVIATLGCSDGADAAARLRSLDPARGVYVPGIGLCNPAFADAVRRGVRRARRRSSAA